MFRKERNWFREGNCSLYSLCSLSCSLHSIQFIAFLSTTSSLSSKRNKPLLFSIDSSPSHNSLTFISIPITSSKQALNTIIPFNCISPILSHPRGLRIHRQLTSSMAFQTFSVKWPKADFGGFSSGRRLENVNSSLDFWKL